MTRKPVTPRRLQVRKEAVRLLTNGQLDQVGGGTWLVGRFSRDIWATCPDGCLAAR